MGRHAPGSDPLGSDPVAELGAVPGRCSPSPGRSPMTGRWPNRSEGLCRGPGHRRGGDLVAHREHPARDPLRHRRHRRPARRAAVQPRRGSLHGRGPHRLAGAGTGSQRSHRHQPLAGLHHRRHRTGRSRGDLRAADATGHDQPRRAGPLPLQGGIPSPRPAARRDGCCGHRRPDAAGAAHRPRPNPDSGGVQGWDGSWASRAEIHQATGMVLSQLGVSATDAFARSAPTPSPSNASWSRSPPTSCPPAAIHRMTVHRISTSGPRHRVSWREG